MNVSYSPFCIAIWWRSPAMRQRQWYKFRAFLGGGSWYYEVLFISIALLLQLNFRVLMPRNPTSRRNAFTLVELLVVIAIIGILIGMLLPAVQMVRAAARRSACQNNCKQIGLAILNYESGNMKFPPGQFWTAPEGDSNRLDYAWSSLILPYIEANNVYDGIDFKQPYTAASNVAAAASTVPGYLCPSTSERDGDRQGDLIISADGVELACIDYMGLAGPSSGEENPATGEDYERQQGILTGTKGLENFATLLVPPAVKFAMITDGSSNTMMVTECTGRGTEAEDDDPNGAWVSGKNITHLQGKVNGKKAKSSWNDELIYSEHTGGANALFCDGSVHFLSSDVSKKSLLARASRSGDEPSFEYID